MLPSVLCAGPQNKPCWGRPFWRFERHNDWLQPFPRKSLNFRLWESAGLTWLASTMWLLLVFLVHLTTAKLGIITSKQADRGQMEGIFESWFIMAASWTRRAGYSKCRQSPGAWKRRRRNASSTASRGASRSQVCHCYTFTTAPQEEEAQVWSSVTSASAGT